MTQAPKKKQLKKKKAIEKEKAETDHEIMERLFGKRVMKVVDGVVSERSEIIENSGRFEFMRKS